ncbi:MAG: cold shock domain-containing protein [Pirellulaceae bacterium]
MQGTIHRIKFDRGFGFVRPEGDDGSGDHFFHCRDLCGLAFDQQLVGQRVEFDSSHSDKGLRAANIQPVAV